MFAHGTNISTLVHTAGRSVAVCENGRMAIFTVLSMSYSLKLSLHELDTRANMRVVPGFLFVFVQHIWLLRLVPFKQINMHSVLIASIAKFGLS